ncbi:unnamed protein product, partial [Pleuronectes platessa]
GRAASSTEAASDPLALLGLIIAGPLGMLEQVSERARLHHITSTPHCWQRRESRPSGWGTGGASWCQLRGEISKVADTCPNSCPPAPTMHLVRPGRPIVGK